MMGSHNMVTERVSITIKGKMMKGKINKGCGGRGNKLWQLKGFWSP